MAKWLKIWDVKQLFNLSPSSHQEDRRNFDSGSLLRVILFYIKVKLKNQNFYIYMLFLYVTGSKLAPCGHFICLGISFQSYLQVQNTKIFVLKLDNAKIKMCFFFSFFLHISSEGGRMSEAVKMVSGRRMTKLVWLRLLQIHPKPNQNGCFNAEAYTGRGWVGGGVGFPIPLSKWHSIRFILSCI